MRLIQSLVHGIPRILLNCEMVLRFKVLFASHSLHTPGLRACVLAPG